MVSRKKVVIYLTIFFFYAIIKIVKGRRTKTMVVLSIMLKILAFLGLFAAILTVGIIVFLLIWAVMTIIDVIWRR